MYALSLGMIDLLSKQYQHETCNSLRYYQRAIFAEQLGLNNIASFFKRQASGERDHADRVLQFAIDRNVIIPISGLTFTDADIMPGAEPVDLFRSALIVEENTTAMLENMLGAARDERDYMTEQWLLDPAGLIKEQVEEHSLYTSILDRIAQMSGPTVLHDLDVWIGKTYKK
jgi:ferritin